MGEVKKFVKDSDDEENDPIDTIINFVTKLGISQEDCEEIQIDHLKEILSYLTGEKKS